VQCVWKMVALSISPATALGVLIRRGAPTDCPGTARATGLSAALPVLRMIRSTSQSGTRLDAQS
jgi:hypothetical protein